MERMFWILTFFCVLVLGIGTMRGEQSIENYTQLKKSRDALQQRITTLQNETQNYRKEIQKIVKSKSYAKKILRDRYHVLEEDESIIFFED